MSTSDDRQTTPRPSIGLSSLLTMAGWYLAVLLAFAAWVAALPDTKTDGSCEGIGFGCTPTPRDGALIVGYVFGLPALLLAFVISCATLAIGVRRFRSGLAAGTVAALIGLAAAAAGVCALAVGQRLA